LKNINERLENLRETLAEAKMVQDKVSKKIISALKKGGFEISKSRLGMGPRGTTYTVTDGVIMSSTVKSQDEVEKTLNFVRKTLDRFKFSERGGMEGRTRYWLDGGPRVSVHVTSGSDGADVLLGTWRATIWVDVQYAEPDRMAVAGRR